MLQQAGGDYSGILTALAAQGVELAYRLDVPIATQDKEIIAAAKSLKVSVL